MKHINWKKLVADVTSAAISVGATTVLSSCATQAPTATLTRSVQVAANPDAVWTAIGPYCAIKDWLPPIGTCTQDGASPPTRTLVTKDGSATFVETQTARNDARHTYSYALSQAPCR